MSAFTALTRKARAPAMIVVLPPSAFADDWEGRPDEDVAVGLRLLSENDIQAARRIATDAAVKQYAEDGRIVDHDAYIDAANDGLVREAIARAMCDPNDVTQPHPLLPYAQDLVMYAFTSAGARFVWDELHRLTVAHSPLVRPAEDGDVEALAALLARGALERLPPSKAIAARKLLASVLEDCSDVAHLLEVQSTPDEATGEAVYVVR